MLVRLIAIGAVISTACSMSPQDAHAEAQSQGQAEPSVTVTVPSACADVWPHFFTQFERSWNVTVLEPNQKEQELPMSDVLDHFVVSVPGLVNAMAPMDRLDRDLLYVRLHTLVREAAHATACRARATVSSNRSRPSRACQGGGLQEHRRGSGPDASSDG
jgi:hypothetical protein